MRGAPQQRRQVLAECHGLDLSRYQATRSLKYLLVSSLGKRRSKWQCSLFVMNILIVYSFRHSCQNSQKKITFLLQGVEGESQSVIRPPNKAEMLHLFLTSSTRFSRFCRLQTLSTSKGKKQTCPSHLTAVYDQVPLSRALGLIIPLFQII